MRQKLLMHITLLKNSQMDLRQLLEKKGLNFPGGRDRGLLLRELF